MAAKNTTPNPLVYTLSMKPGFPGRVHRANCKYIPAAATIVSPTEVAPEVLMEASRATCCSVRELDREAAAQEAREAQMAEAEAADAPAGAEAVADAATDAPATPKAKGTRGTRTFDPTGATEHTCEGECGEVKKVAAFPTVAGGKRGVECRTCRDKRAKARKDAK
jgi:hypothetical protein